MRFGQAGLDSRTALLTCSQGHPATHETRSGARLLANTSACDPELLNCMGTRSSAETSVEARLAPCEEGGSAGSRPLHNRLLRRLQACRRARLETRCGPPPRKQISNPKPPANRKHAPLRAARSEATDPTAPSTAPAPPANRDDRHRLDARGAQKHPFGCQIVWPVWQLRGQWGRDDGNEHQVRLR